MKECTKCHKLLPFNKFWKRSQAKDELDWQCKDCLTSIIRIKSKKFREKHKGDNYFKNVRERSDRKYPWTKTYYRIQNRCNDPKHLNYDNYGGRGIKNLLTKEDLKCMWFLDEAYDMKQPSIDRIDPNGHYTLENCRYLELAENMKRKGSKTSTD